MCKRWQRRHGGRSTVPHWFSVCHSRGDGTLGQEEILGVVQENSRFTGDGAENREGSDLPQIRKILAELVVYFPDERGFRELR